MGFSIRWAKLIQVIHFSLSSRVYSYAQSILFERHMYNDVLSECVDFKDGSQVTRYLHKIEQHIISSKIEAVYCLSSITVHRRSWILLSSLQSDEHI